MTSILGIKCEKGLEGVVVFSDFCGIQTRLVHDGPDHAHWERRRIKSKKLYIDQKKEVVIGTSGQTNLYGYSRFLSEMLKDSSPIRKAIRRTVKTHHLQGLRKLNMQIERSSPDPNPPLIRLLIATRYNNDPRLFQSNENGYLLEVPAVLLGSGAGLMLDYLSRHHKIIPSEISIPEGILLGFRCLQEAYRDPFTSGIDLIVVTRKEIYQGGERIREPTKNARRTAIHEIINRYKQ